MGEPRVAQDPLVFNTMIGSILIQPGTTYIVDEETNTIMVAEKIIGGFKHKMEYNRKEPEPPE